MPSEHYLCRGLVSHFGKFQGMRKAVVHRAYIGKTSACVYNSKFSTYIALEEEQSRIFEGMTISADMADDAGFLDKIKKGIYQLAVVHEKPIDPCFTYVKCGHESLYISLKTGNPLSFYPEIHLKDLNGLTILLLSRIGFWSKIHRDKTPDSKYLLQVEDDSFFELASNSDYPIFSSSYFINRGEVFPDRINIPIADPECSADYYLVCLASEKNRFEPLFKHIRKDTIK